MVQRPLTVLQVLPALESGGVERGTLEVARALVARGHRAWVMSAGGRMVAELEAAGAVHTTWPVGRKALRSLALVPRLRRFLAGRPIDIVHVRSRLPAWLVWLAWRGMDVAARPRLVTSWHGFYRHPRYSCVMARGERVIAVSGSVAAHARRSCPGLDADRLRVIPRGIDPAQFPFGYRPSDAWQARWYKDHPQMPDKFVVTLPARLTRWKGQLAFVELIDRLRGQGVPAHGLVVGDTPRGRIAYKREIRAAIAQRGLDGHITMTGHRDDLREILAISDVVVSLSSDPEAFGRVTLEALGMGRPVAGFDHGGVGEQLRVLLPAGRVPVGDLDAMQALLRDWREHPPAVNPDNPFTLQRMTDETLAVYDELRGPARFAT